MKKWFHRLFLFLVMTALFVPSREAKALVCADPFQVAGTAWCDEDSTRYKNNILCLAEPVEASDTSAFDEELSGGGVCILAKFKTPADLERLVDLVISYEFPADPLMGPSDFFSPDIETLNHDTGEYLKMMTLDEDGEFDFTIKATVIADDGNYQEISFPRKILRLAAPHLTVTGAHGCGQAGSCPEGAATNLTVNPVPGGGDGAGGTTPTHTVSIDSPTSVTKSVDLCVNTHGTEGSSGEAIRVTAENRITDRSVSATSPRQITLKGDCTEAGHQVCQQVEGGDFCPGGFVITVPVANGENKIDLDVEQYVSRPVIGYQFLADERISVEPFNVDLQGPKLCVRYLRDPTRLDSEIADVDGKALLATEADHVTVDVTLGPCDGEPEAVTATVPDCAPQGTSCDSSAVCVQKQNEKVDDEHPTFVAACPRELDGKTHYQIPMDQFHYPGNTVTVKGTDDKGNLTVETHTFGYGNIHPFFKQDEHGVWQFDLPGAMIPAGVGAFLPADYVRNDLRKVLNTVLNSRRFKDEVFPKMLDPHTPVDSEIQCLRQIEGEIGCSMDHLASKDRVVSIKLFCGDPGQCNVPTAPGQCTGIGEIVIPDNCPLPGGLPGTGPCIYFMNDGRLRVQLKVMGLKGRAEMYTIRFKDTDGDQINDTEDDDADNDGICDRYVGASGPCTDANHDGICDEEVGLSGGGGVGLNSTHRCHLDKSIPRDQCPDVHQDDPHYWGCSDQDDDGDTIPDNKDLPGYLDTDPDFGTYIIPVNFNLKELALNLDLRLAPGDDGRLKIEIAPAEGNKLVQAIADGDNYLTFDCDKDCAETFWGTDHAEDTGAGRNPWIDTAACNSLETANATAVSLDAPDHKQRKFQAVNQQFTCTFNAMLRCSVPKRAEEALKKFENNKVTAIRAKMFDKNFHMDAFAPLDLLHPVTDRRGLGLDVQGLVVPAGVSDKNDTTERDSIDFLNNKLPAQFKNAKFGPLLPPDETAPDPQVASMNMGSQLNLALKGDLVNSLLQTFAILIDENARQEGELHQSLDLTATKLREKFDMGVPDIGNSICLDKNGQMIDPTQADGGTNTNWKCFPFPLNVENVLGKDTLKYVGSLVAGSCGGDNFSLNPVLLRNGMNPQMPPTIRVVNLTPIQAWDGSDPTRPAIIQAELEIGLGNMPMSVYEEQVENCDASPIHGTGEIKNWCDNDRFPDISPRCDTNGVLPIVTFNASGRLFLHLKLIVGQDGLMKIEAGVASRRKTGSGPFAPGQEMELDGEKTYLDFTVTENNTILPDHEIAAAMKGKVVLLLSNYLYGNAHDIRVDLPTESPLPLFCDAFQGEVCRDDGQSSLCKKCECIAGTRTEDCESVDPFPGHPFGVDGFTLTDPLLEVTGPDEGEDRYLTIGAGLKFKLGGEE